MANPQNVQPIDIAPTPQPTVALPSRRQVSRFLGKYWLSLSAIAGLVIVGCLPYRVSPSGRVQLLPLSQQRVQVAVPGRIDRVLAEGGDGTVIPAGQVLATLEDPELESHQQTIQEQINIQAALLREAEAELSRLQNLPRPEEVEIARSKVDVSQQQIAVAQQELATAITRLEFSRKEALRYQQLFESGAVSQQEAARFQQQADVNQSVVSTQQSHVLSKQQQLQQSLSELEAVLAGADPAEIQAARERVLAVQAEIRQQREALKFVEEELGRAQLQMPFEGRLVDRQLSDKVGTHLEEGDTFAVAEVKDSSRLKGQVQIPEVSADQLAPGRDVEVRLLAFPNEPIMGTILAIEPSASLSAQEKSRAEVSGETFTSLEPAAGRMLHVMIEISNPNGQLKPGMTGYAKIAGETTSVAQAFSRSLVRFIKVEVWSWLP